MSCRIVFAKFTENLLMKLELFHIRACLQIQSLVMVISLYRLQLRNVTKTKRECFYTTPLLYNQANA